MKKYIKHDPWNIIEEGYNPEFNKISESLFSIGNGKMGQRANFEESFSGPSLQGSYVAGVYYPDKTRVGWWKNGYPEYFAKVLNAANWIGIDVTVGEQSLDVAKYNVLEFKRILNMQEGYLERHTVLDLGGGREIEISSVRFCSMKRSELGAIQYKIKLRNFSDSVVVKPYIDFDVINEDSNYGEKFWDEVGKDITLNKGWVTSKTKKTDFHVCTGMLYDATLNGKDISPVIEEESREKYVGSSFSVDLSEGDILTINKYAANISSEYHGKQNLEVVCLERLQEGTTVGFDALLEEQKQSWKEKWEESDIVIEGDVAAQQGIRFNIFQLNQTYTGEDERLNIGPKGFTGEKYGGSTYWDTEAYCLPFYLSTADERVARNLLFYRYKHLDRAIENAEKLGFKDGAALYPMVTMNGEECHNEWEITFEEIHRNGAIAYAIYDFTRYTGDHEYLHNYGLEVLIGISRFWAQRVNFSEAKGKYVMLGVTGPNEYENNVSNNWYTNYIAVWTLKYTIESINELTNSNSGTLDKIKSKTGIKEEELESWQKVIDNMYFPEDAERGIHLQQDGFLDKEIVKVADLDPSNLPLNQNWSWDRILRSCYIKQADVLQGQYFFEDDFSLEDIKVNFDFYEPLTVHESSLSPCVHVILASKLGYQEKAYEMYLRTARLDIDDYNNDTEEGCHITSMAGTWMSFVKGFGGMKVSGDTLSFDPYLPKEWESYDFSVRFRGAILHIGMSKDGITIRNTSEESITFVLKGKDVTVESNSTFKTES